MACLSLEIKDICLMKYPSEIYFWNMNILNTYVKNFLPKMSNAFHQAYDFHFWRVRWPRRLEIFTHEICSKIFKVSIPKQTEFWFEVNLDIFYVKMFIIVLSCIFFLFGHEIQQRLQLLYLIFYEGKNFICSLEKLDFFVSRLWYILFLTDLFLM